ncbi:C-type lectin domain family 4 member K-like protein [Cricetulus griseus]|nr:C-type lectin domain family 4 member K-like protein [Cricetulus griseus]
MPEVKMKESEAPDAHFTVDKQNISLWPRGKCQLLLQAHLPDLSPVLRKPLSLRVAFICLSLVLVASIVLQAVFYPRLVDKILDVKSDAQMLRDRADNISSLGSVLEKDRGRVEEAEVQIQILNTSLTRARSQILSLRIIMEQASAQISVLTRNWEEVDSLSSKIPELQRDLDKSSALNAKVRGLQNSLENVNKLLQRQSEPNNTGNNEHCGNIRVSSLQAWNDASCDSKFPFICKRPFIQAIP